MSALLFPTADALRLALASGVVPAAVAGRPVGGGRGDGGELWLAPADSLPPSLLPALARFGVRAQSPPPALRLLSFPCWAALLPLKPDSTPPGPVLVKVPSARLAGFVADVQRLRPQAVRFAPDHPHALVLLPHPPTHLLDTPDNLAFHSPTANVWLPLGWAHPLPDALTVPPNTLTLVTPQSEWHVQPAPHWLNPADLFPLSPKATPTPDAPLPPIPVPVRVKPHPTPDAAEALWVFEGTSAEWREWMIGTDEKVVSRFLFAVLNPSGQSLPVSKGGSPTRIFARPVGRGRVPVLPQFLPFTPHPLLSNVFLAVGFAVVPAVRADRFAKLLALRPGQLAAVEPAGVQRVPLSAFRPFTDFIAYTAPRVKSLRAWAGGSAFQFLEVRPFAPTAEPVAPLVPPLVPVAPLPPSWLGRLAGKLLKPAKKEKPPKPVAEKAKRSGRTPPPAARTTSDRAARRRDLEQQAFDSPASATVWAELAAATSDTARPTDVALCWVNALWPHDVPPAGWVSEWVRAEARSKPGPRLAAAVLAEIGTTTEPHPEAGRVPELVKLLDAGEADLPVRAVWLARLGAAKAVGGDPLALARCRDRLLARLATDGPALDVDAPAFLRFHGTLDGDRFRAAREWLLHVREPMHQWIHRLATGQRMAWAGFDPDPRATAAYADLMLAWGLSRLGERGKADEWADRAARTLLKANAEAVPAALVAKFRARLRDAHHGRGQPAAPPPVVLLDPDSAYVVAKLAERSRILAPHTAPNPYSGLDLAPLFGTDALAGKLAAFARHPTADAATTLLAEAATDPTAATLPRVALAVADSPVSLSARTADRLLVLFPRVIELLPEGVRLAADPHADGRGLVQRYTTRAVALACRLARRYDLNGGFGAFVRFVLDSVNGGDGVVKAAAEAHLPELFLACRTLGLTELAGELAGTWAGKPLGWFVMGREEQGWGLLDTARETLFSPGGDDRTRTAAAFEYVAALTHAPPRLALGRLEELFQRLDRITTAGATARYFALAPLELIDRAVSAVVTDEFNLGPAVRRWLDADEFAVRRRIAADLNTALTGV